MKHREYPYIWLDKHAQGKKIPKAAHNELQFDGYIRWNGEFTQMGLLKLKELDKR